jgi:hypothetical protein
MSCIGQDELDALTTTLQAGEEGSFELLASLEDKGSNIKSASAESKKTTTDQG